MFCVCVVVLLDWVLGSIKRFALSPTCGAWEGRLHGQVHHPQVIGMNCTCLIFVYILTILKITKRKTSWGRLPNVLNVFCPAVCCTSYEIMLMWKLVINRGDNAPSSECDNISLCWVQLTLCISCHLAYYSETFHGQMISPSGLSTRKRSNTMAGKRGFKWPWSI